MMRLRKGFWIIIVLAGSFWGEQSFALLKFEDAIFPELATSSRPLSMGNAFINRVDDSNSVFYNPAGLGTIRTTKLHLTNIHLETNKGLVRAGTGGHITKAMGNVTKGFDLDGSRELLLENRGTMTHSRFNILPNITTRFMSLGYLYSKQSRATLGLESTALYEFASRRDFGPYLGINFSLFGGIFKLGLSGIYLNRREILGERDPNTALNLQDSEYKKGKAFILTAGTKLVLPITFLPTFGLTYHNVTGKSFSASGAGPPDSIKQSMDVGFSLTPQIGNSVRVHIELNYKDLSGEFPEVSVARKILLGAEFDFARFTFLRFGYGDGFGCMGFGLRNQRLEFDLTSYAVDTTSSEFRGAEDRRFAMTISSGI